MWIMLASGEDHVRVDIVCERGGARLDRVGKAVRLGLTAVTLSSPRPHTSAVTKAAHHCRHVH